MRPLIISNSTVSVAEYLLLRLKQLGLEKIFQVPGDYVQGFMDALEQFDGIDAVGTVNELGAGYAADGYARLKGIGAISMQYGVGTLSALNAVAGSYVERNPVVVITASPSAADRRIAKKTGVLFHHSTDNFNVDRDVFENVTVASEIINDCRFAPFQIDAALVAAITHKRPVYLEAWQNVWAEECVPPEGELHPDMTQSNPRSLACVLEKALSLIVKARQPVVILGIEIARFGLQDEVTAMLKQTGLAYTTTTLAKTVLDERAGRFVGTYAGPASRLTTNEFVVDSDCIVALGCIFTDDYLDMMANQYDQMIQVNVDTTRVGNEFFGGINLGSFIESLTVAATHKNFPRNDVKLPEFRVQPAATEESLEQQLTYTGFFDLLGDWYHRECRFEDVHLILGESSSLYTASNLVGLPKDCFISDAAWGSLGHETGCAVGVALGSNRRPLVVAGDGGFMMMCQALSTISRNQLNVVVFVMSNRVYAIEQSFVNICAFFEEDFAPFDILPAWDYPSLAKAFGVTGFRIENGREMLEVLKKLSAEPGQAALVEVCIPQKDLAPQIERLADPDGNKVNACQTDGS